jgi:hypothetical protein
MSTTGSYMLEVPVTPKGYFGHGDFVTSPDMPGAVGTVVGSSVEVRADVIDPGAGVRSVLRPDLPPRCPEGMTYTVIVNFVWGRRAGEDPDRHVTRRVSLQSNRLVTSTKEAYEIALRRTTNVPDFEALEGRRDRLQARIREAEFAAELAFTDAFDTEKIRQQVAQGAVRLVETLLRSNFGLGDSWRVDMNELAKTPVGKQIGVAVTAALHRLFAANHAEIVAEAEERAQAVLTEKLKAKAFNYDITKIIDAEFDAVDKKIMAEFLPTMTAAYEARLKDLLHATKTQDALTEK